MLGDSRSGSKVWEALDREIGKPWENRGQIDNALTSGSLFLLVAEIRRLLIGSHAVADDMTIWKLRQRRHLQLFCRSPKGMLSLPP